MGCNCIKGTIKGTIARCAKTRYSFDRMHPPAKKVSVVLPATDEPLSLEETVRSIREQSPTYSFQFIIVTHPRLTTPDCRKMIAKLVSGLEDVETFEQKRPGLGGAIQDGFERCSGEYSVLMSSDLETDPAALPEMLAAMQNGADIAATTRWRGGVRFKGYDPLKLVLNFCFQNFFRILFWTRLTDLTYAYRIYRTEIVKHIRWEEDGFPFLFESIVKPLRLGYSVVEIKAPWISRHEGMSHNSFWQTADYFRVGITVRFQSKKKMVY